MVVKITPNDKGNPPGKLADAELHFTDGVLDGLKLIGFSIWERRNGTGRNVTFPARQYSVNGERRSFSLLRPILDATAQDRVRDLILQAYAEHEEQAAQVRVRWRDQARVGSVHSARSPFSNSARRERLPRAAGDDVPRDTSSAVRSRNT